VGWLDRLDDLWDAGFELGRTNVNVALDIATAPFTDDEYEGFFGTVAGISMDYASESMQHLIGPEGLGGVAIGALPPAVRRGGNDTLHALEWAYREGVGEPLSTAFTAGSLLEARGRGDDLSGFFDRDLWSEAYGIAQTRSPGQAFTLMFASSENNNILDDEWRIGVEGTRWFSTVSGILDFGARIYLDPTFLGAKAVMAGRAYREGARVAQYFNEGGGFGRFADDVENLVGPGGAAARMAADAARMADDATNVVSMSRAFRMADDAARMVDDAAAAVGWPRYKHFTTAEGKAGLVESGGVHDPTFRPIHGMGSKSEVAGGTDRFAGDRLYLSLDDAEWGSARRVTDEPPKFVPVDEAPEGAAVIFDYEKQEYLAQIGGYEDLKLDYVEFAIDPSARKLVIDSPESYKAALAEARKIGGKGVWLHDLGLPGVGDGWQHLATRYDFVEIRNVTDIVAGVGADGRKFFKAAGHDQIVVLNNNVVRMQPPAGAAPAAGAAKPLIEALDNLSKEYPSYYFTSDDEGRALYAQFLEHPDRYGTPTAPIVSAIDLSDDLAHPIAYFEGASDDAVRNLRTEEGFRPATTKPSGAPEPIFGTVVYHGARNADLGNYIDPETGELVLRAASNFEGRTSSVSFTDSLDTAWDYSTRVPAGGGARIDGLIFEIDEAASVFDELLLVRESGEELAVNFPVPHDPLSEVRIPKEQFRVISTGTADDAAERSALLVRSREDMARLSDEELAGWYSGLLEHDEMLEFRGGGGDPTDWDRNRIYGEIWRRFSRDAPAAPAAPGAAPAAGAARAAGGRTTSEMQAILDDGPAGSAELTGRTLDDRLARVKPGSGVFLDNAVEQNIAYELEGLRRPDQLRGGRKTVDDLEDWALELTPVDEVRVQTQELSESLGRLGGEIRSGNLEGAVRAGEDVSEKAANWHRAYFKELGPADEALPSWVQRGGDAIDDPEYFEFLVSLEETITDVLVQQFGDDVLEQIRALPGAGGVAAAAPGAAPAAGAAGAGAAGWGGPGAARVHPAFSSKQWGDLTESVPIEFFDDMQGNPGVLAGEVTGGAAGGGAAGSHRARVDDLVESIREEGIQEPLMLEYNPESGAVWLGEGNHRLAAARELGLDSVPVRAVRHDPLPRGDRLAGKKLHSYGVDEFGDAINASGERLGSAFAPSDVGVPTGVAVPPSGPVAAAAVAAGARSEGVEQLAGRIREKYFPNHGDGDLIAYELAQAVLGEGGYVGGRNSMENVMRFFMGNIHAIRRVAEESPAVATRYSRFLKEALKIEEAVPPGTVGHDARTFQQALDDVPLEMIDEINEPHVTDLWHSIDEAIRPTVRRNTIDRVNTSAWYRSHWSMAPVRLVRDMRPQHIVWAGDANSGEQVVRLMQEAGRHPDDITRFRGRWAGAERRERVHIFQEEQANMVDDLLERHFPDADESVRAALRQDFVESSAAADRALSTAQRYDAQLSTVAVPQADGSIQMFQVPMTPGQLEQSFTMVDIKALDRFLAHRASVIPDGVFSSLETAGAWMNGTMGVWKAGALLRPAWTVRVVLDEQLRMIAKMGAWTRMHGILANDRHRYVEAVLARKVVKDGVVDRGSAAWLRSRRAAVSGGVGAVLAGPAGAAIGAGASFVRNRRAIRRLTRKLEVKRAAREIGGRAGQARLAEDPLTAPGRKGSGEAPSQVGAHEVQGAFGDAVAPQVVWERSVSANRQVSFALGHEERALYDELRTTYGSWVEVNPLEFRADEFSERVSRYGEGWERVVNDQYASNQAGRIAFDDSLGGPQERVDRLIEWADTDKGRQFVAATPKRFPKDEFGVFAPADVEDWAKKLVEAADRMVLDRTIRGRLAAGERVRFADVQAIAGDAGQDWRYLVGEIHAQDMVAAKGGLKGPLDRLRGFTEKAFERLGTLPTDTLSRNPYFRHVYESGMERRLKSLDASDLRIHGQQYELSDEALRGMEGSARREALQETRYLLYDLAESSQFADMFRHMMPFYNAWQEVLSRWAGIAIENPAYVARLGAGLRADIDIDGFMETVEVDGERFYQFRLPEFATGLLSSGYFSGAANDLGVVRFRADSLNMVTQGLPGFGPMAQVPASMLVTEQPELEGALRFVLPYGPIKGTNIAAQAYESFKPAWLKRITSSLEEDRSYESTAAKIMISRLADMQNGEREQIDFDDANVRAEFIAEVRTDAQHFMYLRAMASAVSPAAIGFHSPYQPWIDRHRELRSANPVTADEEFLKELSREGVGGFFVMSARFSKNNEGLPATLESEELRNKYIDLVRRYPEVGGLILGIEGGGAARFSSSVYEKQLAEDTSPGSGKKRRERLSLDEIMVSAREREGWSKYGEVSDVVYNEMRRRGLPNLRVKEARDLLWVKQVAVRKIGEEYPLWYAAFRDPDLTKWSDRLEGMRAIVSDERLSGRDDVRLLAEYLEIRDLFTGELLRRGVAGGAVTLEATSNMDLSGVWEQVMDQLSENPTFSDLLWRWLEFDPLKSETWPTRQRTALQASRLARMAA